MCRAIPPLPHYAFKVCYSVKHRDNFTFKPGGTRSLAKPVCIRENIRMIK
jgi:hypothetical protein